MGLGYDCHLVDIIQQVTDPMPTNLSYIVSAKLLLLLSLLHLLQNYCYHCYRYCYYYHYYHITLLLIILLQIFNLQVWLN